MMEIVVSTSCRSPTPSQSRSFYCKKDAKLIRTSSGRRKMRSELRYAVNELLVPY